MHSEFYKVEKLNKQYEHKDRLYRYRSLVLHKAVWRQNEIIRIQEGKKAKGWRLYNRIVNRAVLFAVDHQDHKTLEKIRKFIWQRAPWLHKHLVKVRKTGGM